MKAKRKSILTPGNRLALAFLLLATIAGLLFAALVVWPPARRPQPPVAVDHRAPAFLPEAGGDFSPSAGSGKNGGPPPAGPDSVVKKGGRIALIIDDAGYDLSALDYFLRFPGKLSFAVLPGLPYSHESARKAHAAGKEVILHLPLEPLGSENPGPGAVLVSFGPEKIRGILDADFADVPFAQGVNNHMGSLGTQDRALMDVLFAYLKEKNKYFIDSRTVSSTLGPEYAVRYGVPWADRNYFLDNSAEKGSILRSLNEGVTWARMHGRALLIGHVQHRAVLDVLLEQYEGLVASGIEFATVSEYLRSKGGAGN